MPVAVNILPQKPRKYRFAITPLADAMFQLLIFFMLSTNLTAYSLLPIKTATEEIEERQPTSAAGGSGTLPSEAGPDQMTVWRLEADALVVGGERFDFERLDILAQALLANDAKAEVVLIVASTAQVQDLATVLARLKSAGITQVKLSRQE